MQRAIIRTTVLAIALLAMASLAAAAVPQLINYQGRLTDSLGNPVPDRQYLIKFKIYGSATGDDSLWSSGYQEVQVTTGLFCYQLGSAVPLPSNLFEDTIRWLGIKVSADPELTPRTRLKSVPYAYHALRADTAKSGGGWKQAGDTVCLIDNTDLVGVGTCSPTGKLHAKTSGGKAVVGASSGDYIYKYGGSFSAFDTGNYNFGVYTVSGCPGLGGQPAAVANIALYAVDMSGCAGYSLPSGNWAGYFRGDVKVTGSISSGVDFDTTFNISQGEAKTITHGLGGNAEKYVVFVDGISSSGGIHQANFGTTKVATGYIGLEWFGLDNTQISVERGSVDNSTSPTKDWNQVRIRIIKNQ
jgi:hypothetical protein